MEQEKINRINELARKQRTEGLTAEELAERDALRREYIDSFKDSLRGHLENTYIVDGQGNKTKLRKKGGQPLAITTTGTNSQEGVRGDSRTRRPRLPIKSRTITRAGTCGRLSSYFLLPACGRWR